MTSETYLTLADDLRDPDKCQMHTLIKADRHKIVRALEIMATDPQRPDFGACVNLWRALIYKLPAPSKTLS